MVGMMKATPVKSDGKGEIVGMAAGASEDGTAAAQILVFAETPCSSTGARATRSSS